MCNCVYFIGIVLRYSIGFTYIPYVCMYTYSISFVVGYDLLLRAIYLNGYCRLWSRMCERKKAFCFRRWVEVTDRRETVLVACENRCRVLAEKSIVSSAFASWKAQTKAVAFQRLSLLVLGWIRVRGYCSRSDGSLSTIRFRFLRRTGREYDSESIPTSVRSKYGWSKQVLLARGKLLVAGEFHKLCLLARVMARLSLGRLGQVSATKFKIARRVKNQLGNLTYLADMGSRRKARRVKHSHICTLSDDESNIDFHFPPKVRIGGIAHVSMAVRYRSIPDAHRHIFLFSKYFRALFSKAAARRKRRITLTRYVFMQFLRNILENNQKQQIFNYAREYAARSALRTAFMKMRLRVKRRQKIKVWLI